MSDEQLSRVESADALLSNEEIQELTDVLDAMDDVAGGCTVNSVVECNAYTR